VHCSDQDALRAAWTRVCGGCHPNRGTETSVRAAGLRILDDGFRARRNVRLLQAVRSSSPFV